MLGLWSLVIVFEYLDLDQTSLVIIINILSSMMDNNGIYADKNIAFSHLETAMYILHFNVI